MNKLILVGNGFDLAHGLPTSYKDFLNDFWRNFEINHQKPEIKNLIETNDSYNGYFNYASNSIKYFDDLILNLELYCKSDGYIFDKKHYTARDKLTNILKFKNTFFEIINSKNSIDNWVDIENEYYLQLKKISKLKFGSFSEEETKKTRKEKLIKLNHEFVGVENLLIKYLREKILQKFNIEKTTTINEFLEMYKIFKPNSSLNNNEWIDRDFVTTEDNEHLFKIYDKEKKDNKVYCESYIVDFNYTGSSYLYFWETDGSSMENSNVNTIHGEIDAKGFKPVFGFGDEMDEDYQLIENLDDNEYLKFFKSFQYFQNTCYDGILKFVDNEKFQAVILGHSCGLSDRVLLNTIFEHDNCRSIKIYYHLKEDGSDNYLDIVKNISRHFKDKPSMRRKIVSKELSSPLPQNVRFQKR
jgi:hypothetical protein